MREIESEENLWLLLKTQSQNVKFMVGSGEKVATVRGPSTAWGAMREIMINCCDVGVARVTKRNGQRHNHAQSRTVSGREREGDRAHEI